MVTYNYQSTRQSAKTAYEAQLARIKATQDFIKKTYSLTKLDAYKITSGQMPRITDTPNVYVNNKTGETSNISKTTNINTYLGERGITEITTTDIFKPTKLPDIRSILSGTNTNTNTAPNPQLNPNETPVYDPKSTISDITSNQTLSVLWNNLPYIALGFGAILLISMVTRKAKRVALVSA